MVIYGLTNGQKQPIMYFMSIHTAQIRQCNWLQNEKRGGHSIKGSDLHGKAMNIHTNGDLISGLSH